MQRHKQDKQVHLHGRQQHDLSRVMDRSISRPLFPEQNIKKVDCRPICLVIYNDHDTQIH